jgi:hypothetical protein
MDVVSKVIQKTLQILMQTSSNSYKSIILNGKAISQDLLIDQAMKITRLSASKLNAGEGLSWTELLIARSLPMQNFGRDFSKRSIPEPINIGSQGSIAGAQSQHNPNQYPYPEVGGDLTISLYRLPSDRIRISIKGLH